MADEDFDKFMNTTNNNQGRPQGGKRGPGGRKGGSALNTVRDQFR